MSFSRTCRLLFLLSLSLVLMAGRAAAQESQGEVPAATKGPRTAGAAAGLLTPPSDAVWYVSMDVKRFVENPFGQQVLKLLAEAIREETDDFDAMLDLKTAREKLGRVIGFDPLDGIASVQVYGLVSPFADRVRNEEEVVERMATTGVAVITLSGGTGNLEGLALATPEYESTEYQGAKIHSGRLPDFPLRAYMAVLKQGAGKPGIVVFALNEDQVKRALDRIKGTPLEGRSPMASGGSPATRVVPVAKGTFFTAGLKLDDQTLRALEIPEQQSAIFGMLQRVAVSLGVEEKTVTVQATVEVVNEERAEQIRQLAEGAVAFLHLPIPEFEREEEFLILRKILKDVQLSRDGTQVTCRLMKPADVLLEDLMQVMTGNRQRGIEERRRFEEEKRETEERKQEMDERKQEMDERKQEMDERKQAIDRVPAAMDRTPADDTR